jgi:hypothetical protein
MLQPETPLHEIGRAQFSVGTAVMATGCRQVLGFEPGEAQESWPCANPEVKI